MSAVETNERRTSDAEGRRGAGGGAEGEVGIAIVGGGPAGVATAVALGRAGMHAVVLEQADAVAAAWRTRYDRLRLNTSRLTSRVAGGRYGRGTPLFPSRDEFVAHVEAVVDAAAVEVRTGVRAERVERDEARWWVETSAGALHADQVVVATGYAAVPVLPDWPGRASFAGIVLHSADYRRPEPFRGRDVLVVGAGCSGMEIAFDLVEGGAGRVRLAVRTPPNIVLRSVAGLPGDPAGIVLSKLPTRLADAQDRVMRRLVLGDLGEHGLPVPAEGTFARLRRRGVGPAVVDREVIAAITGGRIEVVAGVRRLDGSSVELDDGGRVDPDVIVAATGYRPGLETLVGHLGVLDQRGRPVRVGAAEAAPGLRFVGFVPVPAQIRRLDVEARQVARALRRDMARRPR